MIVFILLTGCEDIKSVKANLNDGLSIIFFPTTNPTPNSGLIAAPPPKSIMLSVSEIFCRVKSLVERFFIASSIAYDV